MTAYGLGDELEQARVVIGPGGRVVIPAAFRKALGVEQGDAVSIRMENDDLRGGELRYRDPSRRFAKTLARYVPEDVSLVDELLKERRRECRGRGGRRCADQGSAGAGWEDRGQGSRMSRAVLDASAILAFALVKEPGGDIVDGYLGDALASAVNVAEVGSRMVDLGISWTEVRRSIAHMSLEVTPFDKAQRPGHGRAPGSQRDIAGCPWATGLVCSWRRGGGCRR